MRKLVRGAMPAVLAEKLRQKEKDHLLGWGAVTSQEKAEIWQALEQMQGDRCAYCERRLVSGKKHIEHFRKRFGHEAGVFDWHNLFGSCIDRECCGKHKDDKAKNWHWEHLIKPDVDEPDDFFQFIHDGSIRARQSLSAEQELRAQETLRVFNLNGHSALREMRKSAVSGWLDSLDTVRTEWWSLLEQGGCTEQEALAGVADEVQALLAETTALPFATAIRHTLLAQIG